MVKSISFLVGYLFLISTLYYLSFWGEFHINVFQYLSTGDVIKGVAYSIRLAVGDILIIMPVVLIAASVALLENRPLATDENIDNARVEKVLYRFMLVALLLATLMGGTHYVLLLGGNLADATDTTIGAATMIALFFAVAYAAVDYSYSIRKVALRSSTETAKIRNPLKILIKYLTVATGVYFLVSAPSLGISNARQISEYREYDYVTSTGLKEIDSLKMKTNKLIYLGAVSEKYIFSDSGNVGRNHFLIDKSKIPLLYIQHYSESDNINVRAKSFKVMRPGGFSAFMIVINIIILLIIATGIVFYRMPRIVSILSNYTSKFFNFIKRRRFDD